MGTCANGSSLIAKNIFSGSDLFGGKNNAAPLPLVICMIGCGHTTQQAAAGGKSVRTC
jgi:hypothetical protein